MPVESVEPLLKDGVSRVPEREAETEATLAVRKPHQPVLAPPVRPRPRLVVREVGPTETSATSALYIYDVVKWVLYQRRT